MRPTHPDGAHGLVGGELAQAATTQAIAAAVADVSNVDSLFVGRKAGSDQGGAHLAMFGAGSSRAEHGLMRLHDRARQFTPVARNGRGRAQLAAKRLVLER